MFHKRSPSVQASQRVSFKVSESPAPHLSVRPIIVLLALAAAHVQGCSDTKQSGSEPTATAHSNSRYTPTSDLHELAERLAADPASKKGVLNQPEVRQLIAEWQATVESPPSSPEQQWVLGLLYNYGIERKADQQSTAILLNNACDAAFAPACFTSSELAYQGGDIAEMEKRLRQAAEAGYGFAMNNLGFLLVSGDRHPTDAKEAMHWFTLASNQKSQTVSAAAKGNIGWLYLGTTEGMPADLEKAILSLSAASLAGDARSTNLLGIAYVRRNSLGDAARAKASFEKAIEMHSADAKMNLARLYDRGWGVPRNAKRAAELRREAAPLAGGDPFTDSYEFPSGQAM
jgi:TPR repeat protein